MSDFLTSQIETSRRRSELAVSFHRSALLPGVSGGESIGSILGGSLSGSQFSGQNQLSHHSEQLKHFTGRVYAAVRAIMQRVAGQQIKVARMVSVSSKSGLAGSYRPRKEYLPQFLKSAEGNVEVLPEHEALRILKDPNRMMVSWTLKAVTMAQLELTGKAYWWLVRPQKMQELMETEQNGKPSLTARQQRFRGGYDQRVQVWPLPASWVTPIHRDGLYSGWKIRPMMGTRSVEVPIEDMVYFYYPDPSDPFSAMSPLQAIARSVSADEAISDAQRRIFSQGAFPGLAFTIGRHPSAMSQGDNSRPFLTTEQRNQIMSWVEMMYRGVRQYNKPLILDALIEKVDRIDSVSAKEMDFLKSAELTERQINKAFGVNPIVMGEIQGSNRASAVAAEFTFVSATINPKLELISETMTEWLAPEFENGNEKLILYIEPAVVSDPDLLLNQQRNLMTGGAIKFNELRQQNGLPPDPDHEDDYVSNFGLVPGGESPSPLDFGDGSGDNSNGNGGASKEVILTGRGFRLLGKAGR